MAQADIVHLEKRKKMKTFRQLFLLLAAFAFAWSARADVVSTFIVGGSELTEWQDDLGFLKKDFRVIRSEKIDHKFPYAVFSRTVYFDRRPGDPIQIVEQYFYDQYEEGSFNPIKAIRIYLYSITPVGAWVARTNDISISPNQIPWKPDKVGKNIVRLDGLSRKVITYGTIEAFGRNIGNSANRIIYTCFSGKNFAENFRWAFKIEPSGRMQLTNGVVANITFDLKKAKKIAGHGMSIFQVFYPPECVPAW